MKREFLEALGLEKDIIEQIMKEHGKTVQSENAEKYDDLKQKNELSEAEILKLKNQLESTQNSVTNFETEKQELLSKVKSYESREMKLRIAQENNIPFELASRLSGETEAELAEDAKLLSMVVSKNETLPLKPAEIGAEPNAYQKMLDALEN